jgi:SEC-C motif-containing protein
MTDNTCPCGSSLAFSDCCEPLIKKEKIAETAEQLMRSRYSAYATVSVDYLLATTHPSTRKLYSRRAICEWAEENTWVKLEISAFTTTTVTFKAWFINRNGLPEVHNEHSTFLHENGKWYFVSGE